MNQAVISGRLTADPQSTELNSGHSYCKFSLAVPKAYARDGESKVDFINVIAWDKVAENCVKYLAKGNQVAVVGSIQTGSYERNGVKHQTFEIRAGSVEFLGKPNNADGDSTGSQPRTQNVVNKQTSIDDLVPIDDSDLDMPF